MYFHQSACISPAIRAMDPLTSSPKTCGVVHTSDEMLKQLMLSPNRRRMFKFGRLLCLPEQRKHYMLIL